MRKLVIALLGLLAISCGGGGGGGGSSTNVTLSGRVLSVVTTGVLAPVPRIAVGTTGVAADAADGSFLISVPKSTSGVFVQSFTDGIQNATFSFPAATADVDLGDLWLGPEKIILKGTVRNASTNAIIPNAVVSFGGQTGTTNAAGQFSLPEVAYSSISQAGFWGIIGSVRATGFFANSFSASGITASTGVVTVGDVLVVPSGDSTPPGIPYNIYGRVLPTASGTAATVVLSKAGIPVRTYTTGGDGRFYFWVSSGIYSVRATKGALASPATPVTLAQSNQVVQRDVTLE